MLSVILVAAVFGWGYWYLCRRPKAGLARESVVAPAGQHNHAPIRIGLEDDPDRWCPSSDIWTALDDLQLTRLLIEGARDNETASNPTDDAVVPTDDEDTA